MLLYMTTGKNILINTQILTVFKKMTTRSIRRNMFQKNSKRIYLCKRVQNLSQGMNRNFKNMYGLPFPKALKSIQINLNISMSKSNIHIFQLKLISLSVETRSRAPLCSFQEKEIGYKYPKMIDKEIKINMKLMKCLKNRIFKNDKHSSWRKNSKMLRQRLEIWTVSSSPHGRS